MDELDQKNLVEQELIDFYNKMQKDSINEVGYIWMPSIKGFEVYEISKRNLEIYLRMESLANKNKSINDNKESS